jgi:hypothetical protein
VPKPVWNQKPQPSDQSLKGDECPYASHRRFLPYANELEVQLQESDCVFLATGGVSPSVHCLCEHFSDRLRISPNVILRTSRANVRAC